MKPFDAFRSFVPRTSKPLVSVFSPPELARARLASASFPTACLNQIRLVSYQHLLWIHQNLSRKTVRHLYHLSRHKISNLMVISRLVFCYGELELTAVKNRPRLSLLFFAVHRLGLLGPAINIHKLPSCFQAPFRICRLNLLSWNLKNLWAQLSESTKVSPQPPMLFNWT